MEDKNKAIRELHEKIEELSRKHKLFQEEIQRLQNSVFELDISERAENATPQRPDVEKVVAKTVAETKVNEFFNAPIKKTIPQPAQSAKTQSSVLKKDKAPIEEFIGENLLNKIGIAVLVIGIGFGTKYSIDHELLNPLTRIILGYVSAIVLIAIAIRLKKPHENFSAVLLSGGMAVLYFITYAAYDFYHLIPQTMTFILMVLFTCFTVFAAIQYNMEVIGVIGLVGAYAVPFLLSDGSGRVVILFSYISIINTGILILAFKRSWKLLYYLAFLFTWIIYSVWYAAKFNVNEHLYISLIFSAIFFVTFYATFLSYKLIRKEPLEKLDVAFMLLNAFVFYGYGYLTISDLDNGDQYLGLFTLLNAMVHFIACLSIFKRQDQHKDIFYFVAGLVLVFLTLAVPVQLDGNWVTLVWALEAVVLFWIGRSKEFPAYEKLSYPLIILAFGSLLHDWDNTYKNIFYLTYEYANVISLKLFLNIQFLTTVAVTLSFAAILWIHHHKKFPTPLGENTMASRAFIFGIPVLIFFTLYFGIFKEIETFWNQRYAASGISIRGEISNYKQYDADLLKFKTLWLIYYSAIFGIILSIAQIRFIKDIYLLVTSLIFNALVIFFFVTSGFFELGDLRSTFLNDFNNPYYFRDIGNILIRYIGIALIIPLMLINYQYMKHEKFTNQFHQWERILFHIAMLMILSSELVHWLDMARVGNGYKLALSILWGAYALFLIVFGLWKDLKYLRVGAIVLFGVTLVKLFAYDMADMSTISKTIVLIILGVLLLTASFLYNRHKRAGNEIQ